MCWALIMWVPSYPRISVGQRKVGAMKGDLAVIYLGVKGTVLIITLGQEA